MSLADYAPFEFTLIQPPIVNFKIEEMLLFQWPKLDVVVVFR